MPCIIRKIVGDRSKNHLTLADDEWRLAPQVEALESWLQEHPDELDPSHKWIADIGFSPRPNATGGGPIITRQLMQACLKTNLVIYLSEYQ